MPELSLNNIDQISRDARNQEITFSHLLDDLIDHICCDVEFEMNSGLDFNEAYSRVKQKIGSRRLKEIQEETLYAVDSKYRKMKNTMKISGVAGTLLFGIATLLKIQHWPGSGAGLTLGGLILTFVFLPSALVVLWKETRNKKRIFLFVTSFIAGACFIIGTLFKIQHWPGAGFVLIITVAIGTFLFMPSLVALIYQDKDLKPMRPVFITAILGSLLYVAGLLFKIQHWPGSAITMVLGVILLGFVALPWYTWVRWKDEKYISPRFIYIIVAALLLAVPGALINLNLQKGYESAFYPKMEKQQQMYSYLFQYNGALVKQCNDSLKLQTITKIHIRTLDIIKTIGDLQASMVRESEGKPGNPAVSADKLIQTGEGLQIQYARLSNPFAPGPVNFTLLPGAAERTDLDAKVKSYTDYISGYAVTDDMKKLISSVTSSRFLPSESFTYNLMPALQALDLFKNSILTVESCVLKAIMN
jgi:hypothetical protein